MLISFACHPLSSLVVDFFYHVTSCKQPTSGMRNALVPGQGRGNFTREILVETIAETGVRQKMQLNDRQKYAKVKRNTSKRRFLF